MNQLLRVGKTVRLMPGGTACAILGFIGGGGQGEVYRVRFADHEMALKWYFPRAASAEQRRSLEELVQLGAPTEKFLWPQQVVDTPGVPGFGYVMPLRPAGYRSMNDHVTRKVRPTWRSLATMGYYLADSFFQLHARGLAYRDISFGNVFFDSATGSALICDNDNVGIDGRSGGIAGTPRFMAPEIARGDGMAQPSTETDLFSLAVLLFYLFMIHHPLEGKKESTIRCMDQPAMRKLYGTEPVFIFDEHDRSNEPVPGIHDNALIFWPLYPPFLRDLFAQVFTQGLRDPQKRVRENQWRTAMIRLRDCIFPCGDCGRENFLGGPADCAWCRQPLVNPMRLHFTADMEPVLCSGSEIFLHHVEESRSLNSISFADPVAVVTRHPAHPEILGLRNLTTVEWTATTTDGTLRQVGPSKNITLSPGLRINFGARQGVVMNA